MNSTRVKSEAAHDNPAAVRGTHASSLAPVTGSIAPTLLLRSLKYLNENESMYHSKKKKKKNETNGLFYIVGLVFLYSSLKKTHTKLTNVFYNVTEKKKKRLRTYRHLGYLVLFK